MPPSTTTKSGGKSGSRSGKSAGKSAKASGKKSATKGKAKVSGHPAMGKATSDNTSRVLTAKGPTPTKSPNDKSSNHGHALGKFRMAVTLKK